MIRRLLDFLRPGRRESAPAPSEPHPRHATDLVGLALGVDHTEVCEHGPSDRPSDGPDRDPAACGCYCCLNDCPTPCDQYHGYSGLCVQPDPLDPAPARPGMRHVPDVVERQRPTGVPTGGAF